MKPLIYVIGTTLAKVKIITKLLAEDYQVNRMNKSGLMSAIYKTMPRCIIIVEDDMDGDGFLLVDSTISLEYIPTICITFDKDIEDVKHYIKHASYIDVKSIDIVLPVLVQQANQFSNRFHKLHVCQDTYEIMNESIRETMSKFFDANPSQKDEALIEYFNLIYRDNFFLNNRPEQIWVIKDFKNQQYLANAYDLIDGGLLDQIEFCDENFDFVPFMETGFFKNRYSRELSDISGVGELIPEAILEATDKVNNVACYALQDVMMIALNYNKKIGQNDLNILKALTIKVDLLVNVKQQLLELEESFTYTMNALARAAEGKDDVTGHHIKRVNLYSEFIASKLDMSDDFIHKIAIAAQMHDVGKILIPDAILNKPSLLTDEEYDIIKNHTVFGENVIGESDHLVIASKIARHHHERYDGTGYPDGLKGENIPKEARIVALADVYDALRSVRSYKKGFTHKEACDIIINGDGRVEPAHFDPNVLSIFTKNHQVFEDIFDALEDKEIAD